MQRPSNSVLMAAGLGFGIVAWMLTGLSRDSTPMPVSAASQGDHERALPRVTIQVSRARTITREIIVSARTEPNRAVELRAETDGRVVVLGAERGSAVRAGERIVAFDIRDRNARLEQARRLVAFAELRYEGARKLADQQFVPETQIAELLSEVAAARAALEAIELEVANTTVAAPFDAVLQERAVELGDYVNVGDTVAELVDTDPLIVVGEVAERDVHELRVGNSGFAALATGESIEGRIRYVAPVAASTTRTFRVELAIPNPDAELRAGMTAEMRLAADNVVVHSLSPAFLSLDAAGAVGVKTVDAFDRVAFHAITIVNSSDHDVSVSGLPEEIRLITIGHGYVEPGELVEPASSAPLTELTDAQTGAAEEVRTAGGGV
jgi:membrane fusion protein, multidrug efflux system